MPADAPRDPDLRAADARRDPDLRAADAPRDPDLRASDAQREHAAQEIREHFAAGRLTDDELSDRLHTAYSARTERELNQLLSDLPKLPATPAQEKAEIVARRGQLERRLLQEAGGSAGAFLICTAIWVVSGANGFFWPIFVALAVLIPLLRNSWRLYGPAPELDRVERELEARRHRDQHRHRLRSEIRADAIDERRAARYERRRRDR